MSASLMQMPTQNPLMLLLMFKMVLGKVFRKVIVTFDSFATVCYIVDQYVKFHWNIMIVSSKDSRDWEDCFIELLISWLSLTTWLPVFVPPQFPIPSHRLPSGPQRAFLCEDTFSPRGVTDLFLFLFFPLLCVSWEPLNRKKSTTINSSSLTNVSTIPNPKPCQWQNLATKS